MIERRSDTAQGVVLALLLHLALVAVILLAARWQPDVEPVLSGGIAADVVDASALSAAMRRTLADRPEPVEPEPLPDPVEDPPEVEPEPVPTPPKPQPAPQDLVPQPAPVEQDAVVEAPTPVRAMETRPQEEKRRQEQVDLTAERKRQEEAQRQQRLKAEQEAQLAEIRRRRAAAAREASLAEQRLEQLQAARSGSPAEESARADAAAGGGADDGLRGRYAAALQEAIRAKWIRPDNIPSGALCVLKIRQLPGGEVVEAEVQSPCVFDEQGRRSIEAAVLKAQPLPYAGFERVFARDVVLRFRAD